MIPSSVRLPLSLAQAAALLTALFQLAPQVPAAEPVVFRPTYAPGPADNPLKGFVSYAGQGTQE